MLSSLINACPGNVPTPGGMKQNEVKKGASRHTGLLPAVTGLSAFDANIISKYNALPFADGKVLAEYIWIDSVGNCRSKTRTLPANKVTRVDLLPKWNFDGFSTNQAPGNDSEVILRPCRIFKDPFRPVPVGRTPNILVMCDTYTPSGEPLPTNNRFVAARAFRGHEDEEIWYGLEQEYTLFNLDEKTPLGWPKGGEPLRSQGPYYCGVGAENNFGRPIVEAHYRACIFAGIDVSGCNGEDMPGQQEYQVGPCVGIDAGDQLYISRYILHRVCEDFQVYCVFHPKPMKGDWNGAGMHTNVSTRKMREDGGIEHIKQAIYKLGAKHAEHIAVYGSGNELRLTGKHETASLLKFSWGVANRSASIRIGHDTFAAGRGYFEDRRPASNCCPYIVTGKIMSTIMSPGDAEVIPQEAV
mmetsp:Transcript_41449/g.81241  ORF Transcript_41449/g.81241 Transcript_41449/m.81241 type:complete len:413 (-) Transcript_41449:181-1419(-)